MRERIAKMTFQNPSSEKLPPNKTIEHPIQQETPAQHSKPSFSLHLISHFQTDAPPVQSLKERVTSVQQQIETTLEQFNNITNTLSQLKAHLLAEFGDSSHGFISRSIDPMIAHVTRLAKDIQLTTSSHELRSLLDTAIDSVSLYNQFNSEKKLKKKIIQEAVSATHHAIIKDCEILQNYKAHLLQDEILFTSDQDTIEPLITQKLAPIFTEFSKLLDSEFASEDLHELFLWKTHIDTQRGALTELGLITIDSILHRPTHLHIEDQAEETTSQMSEIKKMEDKAYTLLQLLEQEDNFNPQVFAETSQLLADLQEEITVIEPTISDEFQHILESARRTIQQLEKQLKKKQFHDHL